MAGLVWLGLQHPKSTSFAVVIVLAPFLLVRDVALVTPLWNQEAPKALLVSALAAAGTILLLMTLGSRMTTYRVRSANDRALRVVIGYLGSGLINLLLMLLFARLMDAEVTAPLAQAAIQLPFFCALVLCFRATLYAAYLRHIETAAQVENQLWALSDLREMQQLALEDVKRELGDRVNMSTVPYLVRCLEWVDDARGRSVISIEELSMLESRLRAVARDHLKSAGRSLRREVALELPKIRSARFRGELPSTWARSKQLFVLAISNRPIHPIAASATVSAVVILTARFPPTSIVQVVLGLVVAIPAAWVFKWVLTPRLLGWLPLVPRVGVVFAAFAIPGVLAWTSMELLFGFDPTSTGRNQQLLIALTCVFVGTAWAGGATLVNMYQRETTDLNVAIESTRWQVRQLESSVQRIQNELARVVHTDTQGMVVGCALLINEVIRKADLTDESEFEIEARRTLITVHDRISEAARRIGEVTKAQGDDESDVVDGLNHLVLAWDGVVAIALDLEPEAVNAANKVALRVQAVIEIVGEATANAAIHGGARKVEVRLAYEAPELLLQVDDDGTASEGAVVPGMGSEMISGLSSSWELARMARGGSRLTASIPVDATSSGFVDCDL